MRSTIDKSHALAWYIAHCGWPDLTSEALVDSVHQKATIHQVTAMLATSKNVLFPGHNHLLTTGSDDSTLIICPSAT